jgi:BirA family biotin operon repressor/biotin-[acetyl-CoA-carboxylase] ligase
MFSKEELLNGLTTSVLGKKLFLFETIDSTNRCARTLAEAGMEEGAIVLADSQSEGRGRLGRAWVSEAGKNLLFSCILRPNLEKEQSGLLTFFAATAVARALEQSTGLHVECKWPNDLLLNGKKCCGILLEVSFRYGALDFAILGIGVNVNQRAFGTDLQLSATSLARESGKEYDRKKLFQMIVRELDSLYHDVRQNQFSSIMTEWNNRCTMYGRDVKVDRSGTIISGKAIGLHSDGGLVVQTATGNEIVYAGDVTVIAP